MDTIKTAAALFDFGGVIMDTEAQYSFFWHEAGVDYLGMNDLENRMRNQTLAYIYDTFFDGKAREQEEITATLIRFEQEMDYDYIPGVLDLIADLCRNHMQMAVITSSSDQKMVAIYRARPEVKAMFDRILTARMPTRSKPAPNCFLLGMEVFGTASGATYVFEDSFNGLRAGMASEATVIRLATTNPRESITPLCHCILDDLRGLTYDEILQVHR